ncbi:MAG: hypothetical protein GXY77_00960, partial [Fibrobacter sp.]|nr:hypothetical protein [Fibrobacter sp.]
MVKSKIWIGILAVLAFGSAINAAYIDFESTEINSSSQWVAGQDSYGKVFASNYTLDNGVAVLTESSGIISNLITGNGTNSLLYSLSLQGVNPGSYNWSMDTRYSSFLTQYNYGQVYLVKEGQKIDLDTNIWDKTSKGTTIIDRDYPGL